MEIKSLGTQTRGRTERLPLLLLLLQLHLPCVTHKESRLLPHSGQLYYITGVSVFHSRRGMTEA